jgi:hypothetical protein
MTPCMGGWCVRRDQCPHHTARGTKPVERLCLPGRDGFRMVEATPFRTLTIDVFKGREVSADNRVPA